MYIYIFVPGDVLDIDIVMEEFDRVGRTTQFDQKTMPSFKRSVGTSPTKVNGLHLNYHSLSESSPLLLI